MAERAGLEAVPRRMRVRRAEAVRRQALGQVTADRGQAEMGAEELVRRAEQHVGAQRLAVEPPVRGDVHRVGPRQGADLVRRRGDAGRVGNVAESVRGQRVCDHPGPLADQRLQRLDVERAVGRVDRRDPDDEAPVLRRAEPRADVGVVVELGDDDLVAGLERAPERVGEQEVERRHVGAEGDLARLGSDQLGRRLVRVGEQRVGLARAGERTSRVRVRALEVGRHRFDHRARHLRAAGPVEVGDRAPADPARERGELGSKRVDVQGCALGGAHPAMLAVPRLAGQPVRSRISSRGR